MVDRKDLGSWLTGPDTSGISKYPGERLGLPEEVAVYFPQSYNFAGQLVVVPSSRVTRLAASSSDVLAFVVSGGVTDVPASSSAMASAATDSAGP